ncbi:hypothetical protein [Streptomyces sp. NPDC048516]|uniref:hypothetical protein n=1 Tax=Streptomyces sp. NPDC048516 TaxID=3365565 RepID=UPI0037234A53
MESDTTAPLGTLPSPMGLSGPQHPGVDLLSDATLDELAGKLAAAATIVGIGERSPGPAKTTASWHGCV